MPLPNSDDTESGGTDGMGGGEEALAEAGGAGVGEFDTIALLAARLAARPGAKGVRPAPGEVWIGDDAAVLLPPEGPLLLTTDLVVAGIHADLDLLSVADLGWRAMVASVSDVAAMGGRPRQAVVAVAAPPDTDLGGLYEGVADAAEAYCCPVVGGDLSGAERLVVAVTMTGGVPSGAGPVLRSGARPGDRLFVTGPLGASALGLRLLRQGRSHAGAAGHAGAAAAIHRRPRARPGHGEAARLGGARAMVDVSDGLAGDLARLADASGVGFRLEHVPLFEGAGLDDALSGGEDYELVMAAPDAEALFGAFDAAGLMAPLEIGVCVADPGERTLGGIPLEPGGFEHRFGSSSPETPGSGQ